MTPSAAAQIASLGKRLNEMLRAPSPDPFAVAVTYSAFHALLEIVLPEGGRRADLLAALQLEGDRLGIYTPGRPTPLPRPERTAAAYTVERVTRKALSLVTV